MSKISTTGLRVRSVAQCCSEEIADALTQCFQGYLFPFRMTPERYEARFRTENLDPFASRLYFQDESPAGIVMIARRGWTSRLAAMAIAPSFRGRGLGQQLMRIAIREAKDRRDTAMLLEVFEQNPAAVALYTKLGFRPTRRLIGYDGKLEPKSGGVLVEIDPFLVARLIAQEGEPDLPWMLMPETLAGITRPAQAFHLDQAAYAVIANPDSVKIAIVALLVRRMNRRQGLGSRMLASLAARFADRSLTIPALVPEDLAGNFLRKLGWRKQPLNQFEMRLELG
jgi:ribosomal protein S18 acetylase RimI-like enzyme